MGPLTHHQPATRTHPHWGSFPTQTSESQALKLVFASLHLCVPFQNFDYKNDQSQALLLFFHFLFFFMSGK